MRIVLTSVMVNDQEAALRFYTDVLGFVRKSDQPLGVYRWLTVVSAEAPDGPGVVELLLEPNAHPAGRAFQAAMFADGIPVASFATDDVQADYERLRRAGVVFRQAPTAAGPVMVARFEDGCGNVLQIVQRNS